MMQGIQRVKLNSEKEFKRIAGPVTEGAVYTLLSYSAAVASTLTPVDTGALINSQYAPQIVVKPREVEGHVGYTANYAEWVHEAPGTLKGLPRANFGQTAGGVGFGGGTGVGNYWDPNAEPGFLGHGMAAAVVAGPEILRKNYRV